MAINKVDYGDQTLIDLTEDTVTEDKVLEGETFHDRSGNLRTGNLVIPVQDVEVNGESVVNAQGIAEVVVPVSGDVSATYSFESYTGGKVKSAQMECKPIQDLHGYDHPWVGGANENKADFVDGYSISPSGEVVEYVGRCATVNPITIEANTTYYVKRFNTVDTGKFIYAVYNGSTLVRRVANIDNNSALDTSGGDKLYVCAYDGTIAELLPMVTKNTLPTAYSTYSNICPISGHTEVDVDVSDGQATQEQVTVNLGGTYYSGTLDVVTGVFTPDTASVEYDGSADEDWYKATGEYRYYITKPVDISNNLNGTISNNFKFYGNQAAGVPDGQFYIGASNLGVRLDSITSVADWKTFLSNNPMMVVYPLATPTPIQLSPTMVKALVGENHLSAPLDGQEIIEIVARNIAEFNEVIDDENISEDFTYSSEKIEDRLDEYVDKDAIEEKSATTEFETINGGLLSSCKVTLEPIQDLHGYDHPWVGGAGKNKFNGEYSYASASVYSPVNPSTIYTLSTKSTGVRQINYQYIYADDSFGGDAKLCDAGATSGSVTITTPSNAKGIEIYAAGAPSQTASIASDTQLELGSTATTFEPYSNICPISGHTQVEVGDDGKNLFNPNSYESFDITGGGAIRYGHEFDSGEYTLINNGTNLSAYYYRIVAKDYSSYGTSVQITNNTSVNVTVDDAHFLRVFTAAWDDTADKIAVIDGTDETFVPYNGYQVTVNLGGTYYSGTLDVVSGVFIPDTAVKEYDGSADENWSGNASWNSHSFILTNALSDAVAVSGYDTVANIECNLGIAEKPSSIVTTILSQMRHGIGQGEGSSLYANISDDLDTVAKFKTFLSTTPLQIRYYLATPTPIQLSPTMVKALVGENHLSAPLDGQEITESKYRELFTWNEVEEIAHNIADSKIDNTNTSYDTTFSSAFTEARYVKKIYEAPVLTALQFVLSGATSITFNHQLIFSDAQTCCELIQFGSGARIGITDVAISQGSVTFTFDSTLTKTIGFRCRITNDFVS